MRFHCANGLVVLRICAILEGTLPTTANVCRDSTRNEQVESVERVKTSVCRINFSGSSANVTLLSSRKILFPKQASAKVC